MGFQITSAPAASVLSANVTQSAQTNYPLPVGFLNRLRLLWTGATSVRTGTGSCRNVQDTENIIQTGLADIDLTTTGPGGLDTGSLDISKIYYVYLLDDGNGIASLSGGTPAGGFTSYRKVGAFRTDINGDVMEFTASGIGNVRRFAFTDIELIKPLESGVATVFTDVDLTTFIPDGTIHAEIFFSLTRTSVAQTTLRARIQPNGNAVAAPFDEQLTIAPAVTTLTLRGNRSINIPSDRIIEYAVGADNSLDIHIVSFDMEL